MKYFYNNTMEGWPGGGYYSEVQTKNLEPNDWTGLDLKLLVLWFYGDANNATTGAAQMYVLLEDYDGSTAEVRYGDGEDVNDIAIEDWQEWSIVLSNFNDVNLADLSYLAIGFGERHWPFPAGWGVVYFDDIRLYPPRCILSFRSEELAAVDFSNNCIVDFADVEVMAGEWLQSGEVVADVYEDNIVNLRDFAVLANNWLEKKFWPEL
jgi:hypothetical protein